MEESAVPKGRVGCHLPPAESVTMRKSILSTGKHKWGSEMYPMVDGMRVGVVECCQASFRTNM